MAKAIFQVLLNNQSYAYFYCSNVWQITKKSAGAIPTVMVGKTSKTDKLPSHNGCNRVRIRYEKARAHLAKQPPAVGGLQTLFTLNVEFNFNGGGRTRAGYKGRTGGCVTRAVAIAAQLPYQQVYMSLQEVMQPKGLQAYGQSKA